ncbi:MAG: agmatine deiminase family protein, partial [Phycisphaerae bacterium]
NVAGDDMDWTRRSGSTPSSSTGPSSAHGGSYYVYTESSSPNYPNKTAILEGPCFDFTVTGDEELTFWYHMYGTAMGTLYVEVSDDCVAWTTVWSLSGNQGNAWYEANVDLSAYSGTTTVIRIRGVTGSSYRSDMAVDDISVTATSGPECTVPADCDDGLYCNGVEDCVGGNCVPGTAVDCNDGVACTDDSCNEGTDSCDNVANDANCDNGLYCDGAETCDLDYDCQPGTAIDCDDSVDCTDDSCNEGTDSCDNTPNDTYCDNGLYCDGAETCNAVSDCQPGSAVDCDDSVGCTDDSCNEGTDSCDNVANDAYCPDDGLFCNGTEFCDAVADCSSTGDPCGPGETCNEDTDTCEAVVMYTPAEYDQNEGMLIVWGSYTALLTDMTVAVTTGDPDAVVYVVVTGASQQSSATSTLSSAGADMGQVEFITYTTDTVWIRDYGPRFTINDNVRETVDFEYNRNRPNDNAFPSFLGGLWGETVSTMGLTHGGGNLQVAGGDAFMTELILDENTGLTEQDVADIIDQYLNLDLTIYGRFPSTFDSTGHIDMWMLPVSDTAIIIGEYASSTGEPYTITEDAVSDLTSRGYTVYRTAGWNTGGVHYTYTNAVIMNDVVLVPQFNVAEDATALSVFQTAFPDRTCIQIDSTSIISAGGAGHCIMDHVPAVPCGSDGDCDDGLFCNGAETCVGGVCEPGSDPCPGQGCDEVNDECISGPTARLESGTATVGGTAVTVNLTNTYDSPVVVCSIQYDNNSTPVVTRVTNVTSSSFDVYLQNPSGGAVATENVSYLVVEEGIWTIDGVNIEAQTYLSTVTDENNSWVGEAQSYGQSYTNPVVLGQVMSNNDADWSVFWCQGTARTNPPVASALRTGKTVCEDTDTTRANETVGFIVFERGHGTIGGVAFEALVGADSVMGVSDSPPYTYTFDTSFSSAPAVAVTTMAGMDGGNGGWSYSHGSTLATTTTLYLSIDEDQIGDTERNHTTEQVGYVVFETSLVYP